MKLEQLWLHAFNTAMKNGNSQNAVKIANEAVAGWRESGLLINLEQWQGETLVGVDAKAALQSLKDNAPQTLTEAISLKPEQDQPEPKCAGNCGTMYCSINGCEYAKVPCKPDQPQRFYWKPMEQFTEEDAVRDASNCLVVLNKNNYAICHNTLHSDVLDSKYLAHCKEDKGEFVPCWEWKGKQSPVEGIWIKQDSDGFFFRSENGSGNCSAYYPTLEAAQLEAERYYNLYVKNKQHERTTN